MPRSIFALLTAVCLLTVSAAEGTGSAIPVEPRDKGAADWSFRTSDAREYAVSPGAIRIVGPAGNLMFQYNVPRLARDYDRIRVGASCQGSGRVRIGFHLYGGSGYLGTFPGAERRISPGDGRIRLASETLLGRVTGDFQGDGKGPAKAFLCVYVQPGADLVFKDFSLEASPGKPDTSSPIATAPLPAGTPRLQRRLILPEDIYAVVGSECNLYFDNLLLVPQPLRYVFDVACDKGGNFLRRWTFTPAPGDVGIHPLTLEVFDEDGLVARRRARLHVAPADAGAGRECRLLMIGDSIVDVTSFPRRVHELFRRPGNPRLLMLGTRPGNPAPGAMAHEGHAGWTWQDFLIAGPFVSPGPAGRPRLDVQGFLDRSASAGKAPDFITIQLGVNDVFGSDDFRIRDRIAAVGRSMETLVAALRQAAPDAVIGLGLPTPAASQDAFGKVYRCNQTRWQYKRNLFMLYDFMIRKYADHPQPHISLIPIQTGVDCENGFPMKELPVHRGNPRTTPMPQDALHFSEPGGNQLGDQLYAWLKCQIHEKNRK